MVDELHGAIADGEIFIFARPLVIYAPDPGVAPPLENAAV